MKMCKVDGCLSDYKCKGYCRKHYEQWFSTGDPISKRNCEKQNGKCLIDDCEIKAISKGMCRKHFMRVWRHGENKSSYKDVPAIERYKKRTTYNQSTGCVEWNIPITKKQRYPILVINNKRVKVHRFSYEYFVGPIPDGMYVLHKCDNTICSNPDHLFLGTQKENVEDMIKKGRDKLFKKTRGINK